MRANPTVRQTQTILAQLDRVLRERGATTDRAPAGELVFRMPPPWKLARIGWLALITRGTATLSAWGGGPWRVTYRLHFRALQLLTGLITVGMVLFGWGWPRVSLLSAVLAVWIVGYGSLHLLAARQFRNLLAGVMIDILERRRKSRSGQSTPSSAPATQQPE